MYDDSPLFLQQGGGGFFWATSQKEKRSAKLTFLLCIIRDFNVYALS